MIRVLHIVPDLVPYGLENMVAGLVCSLDRGQFQSAVVSLYAESTGGLEPRLRENGVGVFNLDKRRGLDLRIYPRLSRVMRQFRPDILHTHNYVLRYAYPAARWTGVPSVVHTIHNVAEREVDRLGIALQRFAFCRGVAAVTIAEEVSASFRRTYGFAEAAMIPNGIDTALYAKPSVSRSVWRKNASVDDSEFTYLCVARFSEQKDHVTLLRAFAHGPAKLPQTRLLLAGDGQLRGATEQLAAELNVADRVTFLGRRTDMPDTLAAADVFTLASRWEGNPLSVMEAMAAGLPIAATTVGAIPELVRDGIDGMLSAPGDVAALAGAMCAMYERPAETQAMSRSAAARAQERFGLAAMANAYAELYQQASACAGRSAEKSRKLLMGITS